MKKEIKNLIVDNSDLKEKIDEIVNLKNEDEHMKNLAERNSIIQREKANSAEEVMNFLDIIQPKSKYIEEQEKMNNKGLSILKVTKKNSIEKREREQ